MQVKSTASTEEFPDNTSNKFKNRLPNVLLFRELGWKVGLSNITLPVSNKTVRYVTKKRMALKNPFLFQFDWYESYSEDDLEGARHYLEIYENNFPGNFHASNTAHLLRIPRSGTELMTDIRNAYLWAIGYNAEIGDYLEHDCTDRETILDTRYRIKDKDEYVELKYDNGLYPYHSPRLLYIDVKPVENGEMVIDNSRTTLDLGESGSRHFPAVRIGLELAMKMKWIEFRQLDDRAESQHLLGPNLLKTFPKGKMPRPIDIPPEMVGVAPFKYVNYEKLYYKTDENYLYLSVYANWVFLDLDRSFDEAFGDHSHVNHVVPKRPLNVYSNVGKSVITGDNVTDLLRQVPYNPEEVTFETKHIQYVPLRSDVIDIIEVQVSESDGSLADFDSGDTVVTLHFKQDAN